MGAAFPLKFGFQQATLNPSKWWLWTLPETVGMRECTYAERGCRNYLPVQRSLRGAALPPVENPDVPRDQGEQSKVEGKHWLKQARVSPRCHFYLLGNFFCLKNTGFKL